MVPRYRIPSSLLPSIGWSFVRSQKRSFRDDAKWVLDHGSLPILLYGEVNIPHSGPALITMNHYHRPGFGIWWLVIAISAVVPVEIHWSMTSEWTADGSLVSKLLSAVSKRLFPRLADMYGFTSMPPMPPRQQDTQRRAMAVRQVLAAAKSQGKPVIGMAPEGQDAPIGVVGQPPAGVGRFLLHLSRLGYPFYPVGAAENKGALCINFGPPYQLDQPIGLAPDEADRWAAEIIMSAIAREIPV